MYFKQFANQVSQKHVVYLQRLKAYTMYKYHDL